jgi:hypothetical protein
MIAPLQGGCSSMSEPPKQGWYIYYGMKDPVGPVGTDSIVAAIRSGKFPLDANVCRAGDARWVPVITVPEFAAVVREVAPQPALNSLPPPGPGEHRGLDSRWTISQDGVPLPGPYSSEQMVEMILNERVPLTALVNRAGSDDWVTLRDIPLFALAARVVRNKLAPAPAPDPDSDDAE